MRMRINAPVSLVLVLMVAFLAAGCRTRPIQNVVDRPLPTLSGRTAEQVAQAIERAGAETGWKMQREAPGRIKATLNVRKHVAVVSISYTASSYGVQYVSSENLLADGDQIHRKYNAWVKRLCEAIERQAAARA
jgi:hypothetical protein